MAKIFVSASSHIYDRDQRKYLTACFYEQFIRVLVRHGNDVLYLNTAGFLKKSFNAKNIENLSVNKNKVYKVIQNFSPDLAIVFNNSTCSNLDKIIDAPIILWDADSVPFFNDKENIKKNPDRYYFFCSSTSTTKNTINFFRAKEKNVIYMPFATDLRAKDIKQTKNISFIGTNFILSHNIKKYLYTHDDKKNFKIVIENLKKDPFKRGIIEKYNISDPDLEKIPYSDLMTVMSGNKRIQILLAVHDLGLSLYGTSNWLDLASISLDMALLYDPILVYSAQHNQDIYNSSKLSISIAHTQAVTGFPWRVMDIMATNSCLVSDKKEEIHDRFKKYVSIPMYETPQEARELSKKLLKDEIWRKDIILGSQKAIEETARFEHRMRDIEQIFGINLFPDKIGKLTYLHEQDIYRPLLVYKERAIEKTMEKLPSSLLNIARNIFHGI